MKIKAKRLVSIALTLMMILSCVSVVHAAELTFPDLISDNMLIQRDMPIKLWGMGGTEGETIKVVIQNDKKENVREGTATIGTDGFEIELPALEAGGPYTIYFKNKNGLDLKIVNNVLIGELWYQGGQSNMAMGINEIPGDVPERVTPNPQSDEIRLFMNRVLMSSKVEEKNITGSWEIASASTIGYSAAGYQALETIHNGLGGDIPVGGICTPYGGADLSALSVGAGYYNAKIAPATNMNVRGVMWYQGEADRDKSVELYTERLNTFVPGLREAWGNEDMPFIFVQLPQSQFKAPIWGDEDNFEINDYSRVRVAQSNFAMKEENIYQAVTVDLSCSNYMDRNEESAHPWLKKPVGERLGLAALDMVYDVIDNGQSPIYTGFAVNGDSIVVTVDNAYDGLKTTDGEAPKGFMIAGEDGVYYEAEATLSGNTITLKSASVPAPVNASYAFESHYWPYADKYDISNAPDRGNDILDLNVVNSAGLPLGTFATEVSLSTTTVTVPDGGEGEETLEPFQPSAPVEVAPIGESTNKTVLYVALDGKDTNPGTYAAPFATIVKARDTIRELKKAGKLAKNGAVVYIRGGDYYQEDLVVLADEQDSGTKDAPIMYRNYPGEEVNLIGGMQLEMSDFTKITDQNVLNRIVDENAREHVVEVDLKAMGVTDFHQLPLKGSFSYDFGTWKLIGEDRPWNAGPELIVNGNAMTIARYPNEGYLEIGKVVEPGARLDYWDDTFIGKPEWVAPEDRIPTPFTIGINDERLEKWGQVDDAILYGYFYYSWGDQAQYIASIDTEEWTITSKFPSCYSVKAGQMVYVYNLLEEIDMPGEFFVDRKSGKLYYYPIDEKHDSIYYTTNRYYMFEVRNCEYVTIKGITMKYTQSGAVYFNNARHCELVGCNIEATGYQSVRAYDGNDIKIYDCNFYNVEGGIDVKAGDRQTLTSGNAVVENCVFEACDRITKTYKQAVKITGGVGTQVLYNKMFDSDHNIIQFSGNNHVIAFNEISEACQFADDMGAIYAGRNLTCRGNIIAHNYFHDIETKETIGGQGVHAIFLDDFFSAADMYGNVFEECNGSSVVMFTGSHNKMNYNAFINCTGKAGWLMTSFAYGGSALTEADFLPGIQQMPIHSEVWVSQYPSIVNVIDDEGILDMCNDIEVIGNLLYKTPQVQASDEVLEDSVVENNVIFTKDPGFMDLENGKYMLKEDAEVFTTIEGFKPLLFTRMGHYRDRATNRVKDAFVYCLDSPYMFKNGEKIKEDKNGIKVIDGTIYLPVRAGAESADATVGYDEETEAITISSASKIIKLQSGEGVTNVNVNGTDLTLSKPITNMDDTNYISLQDLATILGKYIIRENNLVIISDTAELFDEENDQGIIRYLESEISVY